MTTDALIVCDDCHQHFKRQSSLKNHKCKVRAKQEQAATMIGLMAREYFVLWFKLQRRSVDPAMFEESRYHGTFIKFAKFVKRTRFLDPKEFIKFMISEKLPPYMWCLNEMYVRYIKHIDTVVGPMHHVKMSLKTLDKLSIDYDCRISDVFKFISIAELVELIEQRKLSPWLLLNCPRFNVDLLRRCDQFETSLVTSSIIPPLWTYKFMKHKSEVIEIKKIVKKLSL